MSDDLTIFASPTSAHQSEHAVAMQKGLSQHGLRASIVAKASVSECAKRVVCWGWRLGEQLRNMGREVLVMERGYIGDRFRWTSLAWNGLNGRGQFGRIPDDDGERFQKHFLELYRPWDAQGWYTLIVGQVRGDASLQGRDLTPWYAQQAKRHSGEIWFRPHPEALRRGHQDTPPDGATIDVGPLDLSLEAARRVVTFNSNTGVESVLAGKPTFVEDEGSMAWPMRGEREPAGRAPWAAQLAWKQWTIDEIESGFAWEHVQRA